MYVLPPSITVSKSFFQPCSLIPSCFQSAINLHLWTLRVLSSMDLKKKEEIVSTLVLNLTLLKWTDSASGINLLSVVSTRKIISCSSFKQHIVHMCNDLTSYLKKRRSFRSYKRAFKIELSC